MKKILFVALLAFGCASMTMAFPHKHRRVPRQEMVNKQAKSAQDKGVEAYSDTTAVAKDEADSLLVAATGQAGKQHVVTDDLDDNFCSNFISRMFSNRKIINALFAAFLLCILFVMPFVVIIMLIRYFIKRHNDNVLLAEKAIEKGYPLSSLPTAGKWNVYYNQRQWEKGVRQIFVGAGLMVLALCLSNAALFGVGALVIFMGIGQLVIRLGVQKHLEAERDVPQPPVAEKPADAAPKAAEEEKADDTFDPQI